VMEEGMVKAGFAAERTVGHFGGMTEKGRYKHPRAARKRPEADACECPLIDDGLMKP